MLTYITSDSTCTVGMAENICVSIRVRPLNKREEECSQKEAWRVIDGKSVVPTEHNPRTGQGYSFAFDVYDKCARGIIISALEGQNGTIFVYGQTSSGKTHTMQGSESQPGIVPHGISFIFNEIKHRANSQEFLVRCSYIEIYNENITDLLNPKNSNLKLHTNPKGGVYVGNVTEPVIANAQQAMELISKGAANRQVGETKMNEASSRSHSIFRMVIECRNKSDSSGAVMVGELNMVDLAGSERQSQTQATGARLKEGANINKSLLTLGNVIAKLSEGEQSHVPYRDSKLTRILERALGGNSRTSIICTITPAAVHSEETLSTLKFATRAKTIKNTVTVNEVLDDQALLRRYKKEIESLKKKLRYTSAGGEKDMEICQMINQLQSLQDENAALESEKQELIAAQQEKEKKIAKLQDLVILSGASMSSDTSKKSKPNHRQSWCPSFSSSEHMFGFNKSITRPNAIEEEDESAEWEGIVAKNGSARQDDDMSLCNDESDLDFDTKSSTSVNRVLSPSPSDGGDDHKFQELSVLVDSLRIQLEEATNEKNHIQQIATQRQDELQQVGEAAIETLSKEVEMWKGEAERLLEKLEGKDQQEDDSRLSKLQSDLALVENECQDYREEMQHLKIEAERRDQMIADLEKTLQAESLKNEDLERQVEALGQDCTYWKAECERIQRQLDDNKMKIQELDDQLVQQQKHDTAEQEKLRARLSDLDHFLQSLTNSLLNLEGTSTTLAEKVKEGHEHTVERLMRYKAETEASHAMIAQNESDYQNLTEELKKKMEEMAGIQLQLQEAKDASQELEFQREREKAKWDEELDNATGTISRLQTEQEELMSRIVDLEENLDSVKNERQDLQLTVQELRDSNEELQELAKSASSKNLSASGKRMSVYHRAGVQQESSFGSRRESVYTSGSSSDAAALRRELGGKEQRCQDLEKAKDKSERQCEQLKSEISALKEEIAVTKKELRSKAQKSASLERSKEELEKELEKVKNKLSTSEEKVKSLHTEKSQVLADKGNAEKENRINSSKLEMIEKENEKLKTANLKMKETTNALNLAEKKAAWASSELEKVSAEMREKEEELQVLQQDILSLADERDSLKQQHESLVATHAQTSIELQDLQYQQSELEKLCEDIDCQRKKLEGKVEELTSEKKMMSEEIESLQHETERLREQVKVKEELLVQIKKASDVLQNDLDEAEKQIDTLSKRVETQKSDLTRLGRFEEMSTDLQEQIKSMRAEHNETLSSLTDANFEIQQLRAENQALSEENSSSKAQLVGELEELKATLTAAEDEKSKLRIQFAEFSDTKDILAASEEMAKKMEKLQAELNSLGVEKQKVEEEYHRVSDDLMVYMEKAQDLEAVKKEVQGLRHANHEMAESVKNKEAEIIRLSCNLEASTAKSNDENNFLKAELVRYQEEAKNFYQEISQLKAGSSATQKELDRLVIDRDMAEEQMRERIKDISEKCERAEHEAAKLSEVCMDLKAEKTELVEKLASAEKRMWQLESSVSGKSEEAAEYSSCLSKVTNDLERSREQCASLEKQLDSCRAKLARLESDSERVKEIPRLQERINDLELKSQKLELEVSTGRESLAVVCQERETLQRMLEAKDSSGAQVMSTVSKLSDELQEARVSSQELKQHNLTLQGQLEAKLAELQEALGRIGRLEEELERVEGRKQLAEGQLMQQQHEHEQRVLQVVEEVRVEAERQINEQYEKLLLLEEDADRERSLRRGLEEKLAESEKLIQELRYELQHKVDEMSQTGGGLSAEERDSFEQQLRVAEKVRNEAFHKMTVMKAEYTGRVQRRDKKIEDLQERIKELESQLSLPVDKENPQESKSSGKNQAQKASKRSALAPFNQVLQ
eukprot:762078-Hanusia_phi.AAC.2